MDSMPPARERAAARTPAWPVLRRDWRNWLAVVLVGGFVAAAFRPCLDNSFSYDDADIVRNAHYRGFGLEQLGWMLTTFHGGRYQPLVWASLCLDYHMWGLDPRGYHLLNVALHVANSLLVYVLALVLFSVADRSVQKTRPTTADHVGASVAALLFGLHPLRVEAVTWASQRGVVLSALFLLLAVLLYVRASGPTRRRRWLLTALVCYGLSLTAGPLGVTLPIVLLVLDWYPLGRLRVGGRWFGPGVRGIWLEKLAFAALAVGAAAVALLAQAHVPALPAASEGGASAVDRLALTAYGSVFYLWKTTWPCDLVPLYELRLPLKLLSAKYVGALVVVLAAVIVLLRLGRRAPAVVAAAVCYLVVLLPAVWLVQSGFEEVADRCSYLPSVGWALLAGVGLSWLWAMPDLRARGIAAGVTVLGFVAACGLAALTWQQCQVWRTPTTLWAHAVENGPPSGVALHKLARLFDQKGETERALQFYRSAIRVRPTLLKARYDLGAALMQLMRVEEAIDAYRRALAVDPRNAETHYRLGSALAAWDEFEQAEQHLRRAIVLDPADVAPRRSLGHLLMILGRWDEAAETFRAALLIEPHDADLYYDLGRAQKHGGHSEQAIEAFRRAVDNDPEHKLARRAAEELARRAGDEHE